MNVFSFVTALAALVIALNGWWYAFEAHQRLDRHALAHAEQQQEGR